MKIMRVKQPNGTIVDVPFGVGAKGDDGKSAYETAQEGGYLGTEAEFAEKLATDYIDWFGVGISIPESADLNTYKTNGKYYCSSESRAKTLLNRPDGMNTNFVMWVFSRTSSSIKSQLMLTLAGKMYIRSSNSSAWRAWVAYTTSAEIEAIRDELMEELITKEQIIPEFANDISECTDTNKLYVLPDGYVYGYIKTTETVKQYTDLTKQAGWQWSENQRTNSSGGVTAQDGTHATDYIPCKLGDIIRVKGLDISTNSDGYSAIHILTEDKTLTAKGTFAANQAITHGSMVISGDTVQHTAGIFVLEGTGHEMSETAFMRYCGKLMEGYTLDDVVITVNEEIKEETVTHYKWANTGHAFIPTDYEDRIIDLEEDVAKLKNGVDVAEITVPTFWEDAVNECIAKIKALQVGGNCITFPFFSDNHQRNGYAGLLIAKVMQECHIPYAFYGGDSISSGYIASEAEMIAQDKAFDDAMSYIPNGRFCRAVGNHDGYWNVSESTGDEYHYTRAQVYDLFLREESIAQNKHFGGDGTYYYVDDIASKVRWVVLDTNDGTVDVEQIAWLRDVALSFSESGWAVVFISHQPISNHYHALIDNAAEVRAVVENYIGGTAANKADVVGWFSGHIHRDRIYTGVAVNTTDDSIGEAMPFKQITITSDHTSIAYDDATKHTVANDDQSHAIDFVTINKDTGVVNLTRLGIGEDRSYTYNASAKPIFVDSVDEMTDTSKVYVLNLTGTVWEYRESGTKEVTVTDTVKSTEDNPAYNNKYVSKGTLIDRAGCVVTPYIDLSQYSGQITMKVKGATCVSASAASTSAMDLCDENLNYLYRVYMSLEKQQGNYVVTALCDSVDKVTVDGDTTTFIIDLPRSAEGIPVKCIRFTCGDTNTDQTSWDEIEITIEYTETVVVANWVDTEIPFGYFLGGVDKETLDKIAELNNEGADPATIKLLPKPVLDFYNASDYPSDDYTVSHLERITYPCRADIPVPFNVKWEHNENAMRTTVAVDDTKVIGTLNRFTMRTYDATGRDMFPIYNLLPNHTYYYKVTHLMADGYLVEAKSGSFTTSDEPWRPIYIDGTQNVRDLGGWIGLDGKKVKYGNIFRGATFSDSSYPELILTGKGRRALGDLHVQAELNLGSDDTETSIAANCEYNKIGYVAYTPTFANEAYRGLFKTALEWIVTQLTASKPIYMHCQGGCDRTGTLAFQLLGLLGVSESDLAKEYELSSFSDIGFGRLRTTTKAVNTYDYVGMVEALKTYSGSTITDKFVSFADACGIESTTIENFRELMLE